MILYLDASALVKRYVAERGSEEVAAVIAAAAASGSAVISRADLAGGRASRPDPLPQIAGSLPISIIVG